MLAGHAWVAAVRTRFSGVMPPITLGPARESQDIGLRFVQVLTTIRYWYPSSLVTINIIPSNPSMRQPATTKSISISGLEIFPPRTPSWTGRWTSTAS